MKIYVATFTIIEGEHAYAGAFLLQAGSDEQAFELAKCHEHEPEIQDDSDDLTYWDYGDGTTAARLERVVAITEGEAGILRRLGLAYDLN